MNYKNWDNRKQGRGRGRGGNWNWRGRGYNRMPMGNPFLSNMQWMNSNYNQHLHPHENAYYHNPRYPKPGPPQHSPSVPSKPEIPLPGSEEYTQNKIQQTSDLIKRQLNIDNETCSASDLNFQVLSPTSKSLNNNEDEQGSDNVDSVNSFPETKNVVKQSHKPKNKSEGIDVQEIHDKIIKHISNLSYNKKMNLVNQSTLGYDIAMHEVQKQKRLELSRALRDICKRQSHSSDDGEVINAIIPDIGIKIEDLPNNIIAELSNALNIPLEENINNLVDPEACFKQAEEILNVNFETDEGKLFQPNQSNVDLLKIIPEDIATLNSKGISKSENEYDMCGNEKEDHIQYESYMSEPNTCDIDNMFFQETGAQNAYNAEEGDNCNDYSKDIEFNNFCFDSLDVTKSYLAPFSATKNYSQVMEEDNDVLERLPKITVRKDVFNNDDMKDSDDNVDMNTEPVLNFPEDMESQNEEQKLSEDDKKIIDEIVEDSNPSNNTQESEASVQINDKTTTLDDNESFTDNDNLESFNQWNENNSTSSQFPPKDIIIEEPLVLPPPQISDNMSTNNASLQIHNEKQTISTNTESIRMDTSSSVLAIHDKNVSAISTEELQNDKILQNTEYVLQKRWKSPGEKKMMADVHINPDVSTISNNETLNTTILEQMEEFNKKMMDISAKQIKEVVPEPLISTVIESPVQDSVPISTSPALELNMLNSTLDIPRNEIIESEAVLNSVLESQQNIKNDAAMCSNKDLTDVNICNEIIDKDNIKKEEPLKDEADKTEQIVVKDRSALEVREEKYNSNSNKKQVKAKPKSSTNPIEKSHEGKSKKTKSSEYKDSKKNVGDKNNFVKHESTPKEIPPIETKSKSTQTKSNYTLEPSKDDKLKDRKVKTAAEKKETTPIIKPSKSVYIQTNLENELKNKIPQKEFKNVEVQAVKLLKSVDVQTITSENNDADTQHTSKFFSYVTKLKEIDDQIETLLNRKKSIYLCLENEYNSLKTENNTPPQPFTPTFENTKKELKSTQNVIDKKAQKSLKAEPISIAIKKHKNAETDNEYESSVRMPKRKKQHRNIDKDLVAANSELLNMISATNDLKTSHSSRRSRNNSIKKPLSIKISLKGITQTPAKIEPVTLNEGFDSSNREPLLQTNIFNTDTNSGSNGSETQLIKRRHSNDRDLDLDNIICAKRIVGNKSSANTLLNSSPETSSKSKKHLKIKNRKSKTGKSNSVTYSDTFTESDRDKLFNKNCRVLVERYPIEHLEKLRQCIIHKEHFNNSLKMQSEDIKLHDIDPCGAGTSNNGCDLKTLPEENFEFNNCTGIITVVKVFQNVVVTGTDNGYLNFFNTSTGNITNSVTVSDKPVTSFCIIGANEPTLYTGCLRGKLTTINFVTKEVLNVLQYDDGIQCLEKQWDYVFMGSSNGHLVRYNFKKIKLEHTMKIHDTIILSIKATQEGARRVVLIATRNTAITVRDAMSGLLLRTMEGALDPTVYTILLENNLVYCGTSNHNILVYTFQNGQLAHKYEAPKGIVCMKILKNLLFAGCYNGNIYVYNIHAHERLGEITGPGGMLLSMDIFENKIIVGTKSNKLKSVIIPQSYLDKISS